MKNREMTATTYIFNGNEVLLLFHHKFEKWLPPGGHLEPNETPHEAAIREVREETGLAIELIQPNQLIFDYPNAHTIPCPYVCLLEEIPAYKELSAHQHIDFIFLARPIFALSTQPKELLQLNWFTLGELKTLLAQNKIFKETLDIVEAVLKWK